MKLCKDCKYFSGVGPEGAACAFEFRDLIWGGKCRGVLCRAARASTDLCGLEAKFFEPKEPLIENAKVAIVPAFVYCPVCDQNMESLSPWTFRCYDCGRKFETDDLAIPVHEVAE